MKKHRKKLVEEWKRRQREKERASWPEGWYYGFLAPGAFGFLGFFYAPPGVNFWTISSFALVLVGFGGFIVGKYLARRWRRNELAEQTGLKVRWGFLDWLTKGLVYRLGGTYGGMKARVSYYHEHHGRHDPPEEKVVFQLKSLEPCLFRVHILPQEEAHDLYDWPRLKPSGWSDFAVAGQPHEAVMPWFAVLGLTQKDHLEELKIKGQALTLAMEGGPEELKVPAILDDCSRMLRNAASPPQP